MPSTREWLFGFIASGHYLVRVRMLHYLHIGISITQSHTYTMQQRHTHKAVTGRVEAKKLLACQRHSEYRKCANICRCKILLCSKFNEKLKALIDILVFVCLFVCFSVYFDFGFALVQWSVCFGNFQLKKMVSENDTYLCFIYTFQELQDEVLRLSAIIDSQDKPSPFDLTRRGAICRKVNPFIICPVLPKLQIAKLWQVCMQARDKWLPCS